MLLLARDTDEWNRLRGVAVVPVGKHRMRDEPRRHAVLDSLLIPHREISSDRLPNRFDRLSPIFRQVIEVGTNGVGRDRHVLFIEIQNANRQRPFL